MTEHYLGKLANIFVMFFLSMNSFSQQGIQGTGKLILTITGIRNGSGQINVNLFDNREGFPGDYKIAFRKIRIKTTDTSDKVIEIDNLPFGEYAVAVIHDEDQNNELKTGLFGIPQEGFGFSNNIKIKLGPPDFNDAEIILDKVESEIRISMNYW